MKNSNNLEQIYNFLDKREKNSDLLFWIPSIWNSIHFENIKGKNAGEILVNPYEYISSTIRNILNNSENSQKTKNTTMDDSVIYNSLVRYTTAWDYNHDNEIESGTFLRLIALLPFLKELGVNILYLLPVTKYSTLKQKGDIGSPYAIKSFFELDPNLHDPLLDGMEDFSLDQEFISLVEACHLSGIKVVHDFIPRVTAVNSDLISEHPDWVYWIKLDALKGFCPPKIPGLDFFQECTPENLDIVYTSAETPLHLKKFTHSPDIINPVLWNELKERSDNTGEELLELVEREMKITTAPAHSDWINDVQPIWTDITFLRLYMDVTPSVKKYIQPDQPPYVMFDTIKCNMFPAEQPNYGLWNMMEQAIRHGMEVYGLDGFRVDIGHTVPTPLLSHLFEVIREIKPDAVLISEDLINENHIKASKSGYNIMLGNNWNLMSRINKENLTQYLKSLPSLQIHIFACAETADTPRITSREGGVLLAKNMAMFNYFMPKGVPYITTGFEVNEIQPLNCGLADNTNGAEIPKAFFNKMVIEWNKENAEIMVFLLKRLSALRKEYKEYIKPENLIIPDSPEDILIYGYKQGRNTILCCLNLDMENDRLIDLGNLMPEYCFYEVLADTHTAGDTAAIIRSTVMKAGQALVLKNFS
ncbi:MAG: alpha-amylase [Clostridia bacterium]|nr:alpha-amylase [Clostridia bacterium]